ncbi:hypothetical protein [Dactylosporangium sp. CA-233914]|uniref:hypothetical protein n=1 Tax=Dactylosporangium sp. CA-233914 TaxID=3239934 RepID=UPI003D945408
MAWPEENAGEAWLEESPQVIFHFTPVGSGWINQIETWFGILTRQSIRRGTFGSIKVLPLTVVRGVERTMPANLRDCCTENPECRPTARRSRPRVLTDEHG